MAAADAAAPITPLLTGSVRKAGSLRGVTFLLASCGNRQGCDPVSWFE